MPLARWDGPYSSTAYSLALEMSKRHNVFYIDNPLTYKDFLKKRKTSQIKRRIKSLFKGNHYYKIEGTPDKFVAVFSEPIIPINHLSKGNLYNYLLGWNDRKVAKLINKIVIDYNLKDYVYFNSFNPFYGSIFPGKKPVLNIYQSVDNIAESKYVNKHGVYLEELAAKKADLVLTTSTALTAKFEKLGLKVQYLPNAANTDIFYESTSGKLPVPKDIISKEKPVIGYFGNICHRVDYELLVSIVKKNPDKELWLIGPIQGKELEDSGLKEFQNVKLFGMKKLEELPAYLYHFDVAIIPFKKNSLTESIYPLKINEYLAGGKPVVSTSFSQDIRDFSDIAYIANSQDEFLKNINLAIAEDSKERVNERINYSLSNSWENRGLQLEEIIFNETKTKSLQTA